MPNGEKRTLVKAAEDRWLDASCGIVRDTRQVFRWARVYGAPTVVFTPDATRFADLVYGMRVLAADLRDDLLPVGIEHAASEVGGFADRLEELAGGAA
jgi:hypothetical protein